MRARPTDTVVVVTGGDVPTPASVADLDSDWLVVAADSGVEHALALGFDVDIAVGDFDSASGIVVAELESEGTTVERHPAEKDATDLELALDKAVALGATRVIVVGGHGGARLDHFAGNLALLTSPRFATVTVEARMGHAIVHVLRGDRTLELTGDVGELVTMLAVTTIVTRITTTGLRYPLTDGELHPGSSRGVSNELVDPSATITVADGPLLVIHTRRG